MAITVKGYTKRLNGQLVTVHGYAANRDELIPTSTYARTQVHAQHVNAQRAPQMAPPGVYATQNPHNGLQGLGGLTAYLYMPGANDRDIPVYKWRRTMLPKKGLYAIPRKESGNLDDFNSA